MPCPPQMTVCMCVYGVGCVCVCVVRDMETDTQGMEKWRHGQKKCGRGLAAKARR